MAWLKPFDLNSFLKDTPLFLKATAVLVFLGAMLIWLGLMGVTAIRGQRIQAWVFAIEKYEDPVITRCTAIADALKTAIDVNRQTLESLPTQISETIKLLDASQKLAFASLDKPNLEWKKVADEQIKRYVENLTRLHTLQESIVATRQKAVTDTFALCTGNLKSV